MITFDDRSFFVVVNILIILMLIERSARLYFFAGEEIDVLRVHGVDRCHPSRYHAGHSPIDIFSNICKNWALGNVTCVQIVMLQYEPVS